MNLISEAFILGVVYGFGPCTMSCMPVLVPIVMSTTKGWKQGFIYTLFFGVGRVVVYIALGAIMGGIGKLFDISLPKWGLGIFMIILAVALLFKVHTRCLVSRIKITGLNMAFVAGVVMGLSPCAPLLGALGLAIASKSVTAGMLISLAFGVGTLISPSLLIGALAGKWSSMKEFREVNNYVAAAFLAAFGVYLIFQ